MTTKPITHMGRHELIARIEQLEAENKNLLEQSQGTLHRVAFLSVGQELALSRAMQYGCIECAKVRGWVIDQMVRALTGDEYSAWVKDAVGGGDVSDWTIGVEP